MTRKWMFVFLFLLINSSYARDLKIAFHAGNGPPYAITENNILLDGIIKAIGDELGKQLEVNVKYWLTTRARVEKDIADGRIDLLIIFNPDWSKDKTMHHWSIPIFKERDVFVVKDGSGLVVNNLDDLTGKRVGTIFKYHYANLDGYFEKKLIVRDDVYELGQNFDRLDKGIVDALIDSEILIRYYLKDKGRYGDFRMMPFVLSEHSISSILSKRSLITLSEINRAYKKMKRDGFIEKVLGRFR